MCVCVSFCPHFVFTSICSLIGRIIANVLDLLKLLWILDLYMHIVKRGKYGMYVMCFTKLKSSSMLRGRLVVETLSAAAQQPALTRDIYAHALSELVLCIGSLFLLP